MNAHIQFYMYHKLCLCNMVLKKSNLFLLLSGNDWRHTAATLFLWNSLYSLQLNIAICTCKLPVCVCVGSMLACVSARVVCDMCALHYSCFGFPCALSLTHSLTRLLLLPTLPAAQHTERECANVWACVRACMCMNQCICVCVSVFVPFSVINA